ncbi:TPA: hypothetical protein U7M80_000197 [Streptococcus agalactiae]|nr:hypothetical protein [Streptococcus agalactiae]
MIKNLILYHFTKDNIGENDSLVEKGSVYSGSLSNAPTQNFNEIELFFYSHAKSIISDSKVKNFRFKNPRVQIALNAVGVFENSEAFEEQSQEIADKLKSSIMGRFKNPFYLVVFTANILQEDCLCILKMEANIGVRVTNEVTLETLQHILPTGKARLQKAAIIFKEKTAAFIENRENGEPKTNIHSKVIDKLESNIAGYFFETFLDSQKVFADPNTNAQIAIDALVISSSPYIKEGYTTKDIVEVLRNELSVEKHTSFDYLAHTLEDYLDFSRSNNEVDIDNLGEFAFNVAYQKNNTVVKEFLAKYRRPPKVIITSKDKTDKVKISYYKALEDNQTVQRGESTEVDGEYITIKILKDLVEIKN